MRPSIQNAFTLSPSPLTNDSGSPLRQRESPMPCNQDTTKHIDHLDHKSQKAISAFLNREEHRLNIIFEEYTRYGTLTHNMRLLRYGILVGVDSARGIGCGGVDGVDGRDDGEEVLEFMEVVGGRGDGAVERVEEGGVEGSE